MLTWKKDQNQNDWHMIREEVFVKEQGFQNEFDDIDDFATHICIYEDGKALGCVRFYVENDKMRIGRLAVLKQARKKHLGAYLLELAEREIRKSDYREVYLHVPHVLMKKVL